MKLDRLIGILTVLLQNDKTTAPELARRFEVSRRTILRDLDSLCGAGIPIVTTRGGDGGIAIMSGYKINKNVLTTDELQSLVAGLKGLDTVSQTSHFESLMTKLAPENAVVSLADSIVIDLSSYYKDSLSEKITLLKQAISERRAVTFDYYYDKGEMAREIEPYFIQFIWSSWYVFGWCRLREDFRRFKLNRLWDLSLTDERFELRDVPPEQASGGFAFTESNNIKILFDKSVRFRLIEEYGL
ncbi:MAG: YafY family transcriptional regulator, partial [Oscillospiraceae bacterium]|nr:YafY family transcriptional regulator [Oscillospiraceae bacterium]